MTYRVAAVLAAVGGVVAPPATGEDAPSPILQVVRLKPGESKRVELALPFGGVGFRPGGASGRDFLYLETLPKAEGGARTAKGKPIEHDDKKAFDLTGVRLAWVADRPEFEFRADEGAKAGTTDVKARYESFGGGSFTSGYRVVVEAK